MREIVIVIPDLYLPPDAERGAAGAFATHGTLPGIEYAGRFGERAALGSGWREWLAVSVGRADLKGLAPACIAAAVCDGGAGAPERGAPLEHGARATWIATPVQLTAGLARVHLDHRGILSLPHAEQAALAAGFQRIFGASGHELTPLPSGDFLLRTCGIAPVATTELARCAGGEVAHALAHGAAGAPLRRLLAEIEMWLHGLALNEERQRRGAPLISALWLWGAEGRVLRPGRGTSGGVQSAYGSDAYLNGLWHLQGGACRALPAGLAAVLAAGEQRAVLVMTVGGELQSGFQGTVAQALARLDERFISPALKVLRRGELRSVTLILNDTRVALGRASSLRLWRRPRPGLEGFA